WKNQYFCDGLWKMGGPSNCNPQEIYRQLIKLDTDTCPAKAVDDIIGNQSWSHYFCGSCHEYAERAVRLGDEYDESGATVCRSCLRMGVELLRPEHEPVMTALSRLTSEVFGILATSE